ncbi:hypothetical protein O5833_29300, partial [Escherichia coli]|nr:hypothetical protein [Escherichia coli]
MLWCGQTSAYSGQCHTTQGNQYIGVNFGVKTLEEEANTAGVVKDFFSAQLAGVSDEVRVSIRTAP